MPDKPSPSFAAPMDPVGDFRRLVHEPHAPVTPVTRQQDLFVLAHLGIPRVELPQWRPTSRASWSGRQRLVTRICGGIPERRV
jgi:hypothetical protein